MSTTFEWYRPRGEGTARPLVLVMPILGGNYPVARHLAAWLADRGWHAAFVHRHRPGGEAIAGDESPAQLVAGLRDTILSCRRTLRILWRQPEVDARRCALVGVSLGAITGTILLALEPQLAGGVLVMGGGDLAGLIATSREGPVRMLRRRWLAQRGLREPDDLARALRAELPIDPLLYAPYVDADRVLQLISTRDHRVAARYQWRLWEALGRPRAAAMPIGHYSAIVYVGYAKEAIARFLAARFRTRRTQRALPAPPPHAVVRARTPLDSANAPALSCQRQP